MPATDLASHLDTVLALDEPLACRGFLEEQRSRLERGHVNVVVVGRFKRGKSTLLNALIGRPILPMGVVPVTALVTLIRPGERERAVVRFLDGRSEEVGVGELARYVSESGNPENRLGVERVDVELPELDDGGRIVLADTPGTGSVFRHNTDTLREWLGHIDAGLFVVSTDPPVGEADLELLEEVRATAGEVLVVLNKTDRLRPEEVEESVAYTRRGVESRLGPEAAVVPCSARRALEEGGDEGVGEVSRWISGLAEERGHEVLERAVARRAARRLAHEVALVRMERASAERTVEELADALQRLDQVRGELVLRVREVDASFDAGCRDLMAEFDETVRTGQGELVERVASALSGAAGRLTERRAGMLRFQREIERTRDVAVESALAPFQSEREQAAIRGFTALTERALGRVNELVDDAFERAAGLLGVEVARFDVREGFSMDSRLEYRVGLPKVNLDYIVEGLFLLLPPPLGRPLVTRRHLRLLPEAMGRQLGLIRADLHERVTESAFSFKGGLGRRVKEALEQLRGAVERGMELAALDRVSLGERLARLEERLAVLERAMSACSELASGPGLWSGSGSEAGPPTPAGETPAPQ